MKILLSAEAYPTSEMPFASFIEVLAQELTRQGDEVTVIAPQSLTSCIKNGIPILKELSKYPVETTRGIKYIHVHRPYSITLGQSKFAKGSLKLSQLAFSYCARRIKKDFDLIYCHFWSSAYYALSYAKNKHLPLFVATGEDQILITRHIPNLGLQLKPYLKGLIAVSTKNLDESKTLSLVDINCPTIILPNSVDSNIFKLMNKNQARNDLNIESKDYVIAFCGRLSKRKGADKLNIALKEIDNNQIKIIYIGAKSEGDDLTLDYPNIIFQGKLPHNEIPKYLNAADVFILPTEAEGCSNAIVEAMSCGLPIISSNLPFNYDILDNTNSILIDPKNKQELKDAIELLLNDNSLRVKMSESSLEKSKNLTISNRVEKIRDFISNALKD